MRSRSGPALTFVAGLVSACSSFHEDTAPTPDARAPSDVAVQLVLPPRDAGLDAHDASVDAHDAGIDAGPASCVTSGAGRSACGAAAAGTESCCASLPVEGGTFYRDYDPPGFPDGGTTVGPDGAAVTLSKPATVSSFELDKYLVTVGRFRPFVEAVFPPDGGVGWSPPVGSGKHGYLNHGLGLAATGGGYEPGWAVGDSSNIAPTTTNLGCDMDLTDAATWTPYPGANEYYPINCVNWYEAYAFCIWDGGFLPSDAEIGYARAGGSEQREYPWGSAPPGTTNQYAIYGTLAPNGPAESPVCYYPDDRFCVGVAGSLAPVGTPPLGAGRWGQVDLSGELFEWNLDWYDQDGLIAPCDNCAQVTLPGPGSPTEGGHLLQSGWFEAEQYQIVSSYRSYDDPSVHASSIGIRCARAPHP